MALSGQFAVSPTGAATYSIPISVPPGTAGMVPSLSLSYSSQIGNGLVGLGWGLGGLSSISRCPQTIAQDGAAGSVNFDANDRYCMDGQRLIAISGAYGADGAQYRTEVDTFSKIISHGSAGNGPAWFEVHTKSGRTLEYGHTADSQILAQGKTTAGVWALDKVSDSKSNYYTITYTNDAGNGQYYPSRIDYTGNTAAATATYNSVQFVYTSRPDITPLYQAGSLAQITVLLTDIKTYAGAALVSDYNITQSKPGDGTPSYPTSIQVCDGRGSCLPATSLQWQTQVPGSLTLASLQSLATWGPYELITGNFGGHGFRGHGRTDVFLHALSSAHTSQLYLANEDGTFTASGPALSGWDAYSILTGDWNGDGRTDVALSLNGTVGFYFSDGTQFVAQFTETGWSGFNIVAGDWDGDGRTDIALFSTAEGGSAGFYLSNCTGMNCSGLGGGSFSLAGVGGFQVVTGDWDGDGRTDFALIDSSAAGFYFSTGGSFRSGFSESGWSGFQVLTGDWNGDGKTDIVLVPTSSGGSGGFYYSTGTGLQAGFDLAGMGGNTVLTVDWNGDGRTDIGIISSSTSGTSGFYLSTGTSMIAALSESGMGGYKATAVDFDGDGAADLILKDPNEGSGNGEYLAGFTPTLLTSITNGLGAQTKITYDRTTHAAAYVWESNETYPTVDISGPAYVVTRTDASNGNGGFYSSTYIYKGGKADQSGRGFLGFHQITKIDLQTNINETTTFLYQFPYTGLVQQRSTYLGNVTLSLTKNTYQFSNATGGTAIGPSNAPYNVSLAQIESSGADLDGTTLPTATTSYQYDAYLNPTQVASTTTDGFDSTTNNTYTNDTTNWFLGQLINSSVTRIALTAGQYCVLPWGATITNGQSVTAYSAVNPPAGQACSTIAQTRTCTGGALSGSATHQSCTAICALPWGGTINPGQTVTAYSAAGVAAPQACSAIAQTRTCGADGTLSGSYTYQSCTVGQPQTIYLTSGSSWTVPSNWNNTANKIEVIGGGGGGYGGGGGGNGGGGGGGAYSSIVNLTLTPGSSVAYNVGSGSSGTGRGLAGGDTWFNGAGLSNASVSAQGGGVSLNMIGGVGGQASSSIGTTKYSGGNGGNGGEGGGGGGGAAGPHGNGGAGGSYLGGYFSGGGGGGGADGGTAGGNDDANGVYAASGDGGNNWQGYGGVSGNCGNGGYGGGGSGGYGGDYGNPNHISPGYGLVGFTGCGGSGSMDTAFDASHGSGGGGGGGGSNVNVPSNTNQSSQGYPGGTGGGYGGGGGGGGTTNASGGNGANGLIVITYTPGS
jgi:hypothetical protein